MSENEPAAALFVILAGALLGGDSAAQPLAMGSHASKEDDERHQNKELEKGKDHPDNKKLEANKEFKVRR